MNKISNFARQLRKDKNLILVCLVLAFLAWQTIRKNIGFEVSVSNIDIEVEAPKGWAVWEKSAHQVNVEFNGSREDIRYLNTDQLRVVIPIADPKHGEEMRVVLTKAHLRNPTSAKVMRFSPSEIMLRLDQEDEKILPIKAAMSGSLPEGLEIERVVCSPATVRVSGARQVLEEMESIQTEPIPLDNRTSSFKESVRVALPQTGRVEVEPDWVSVEVDLVARDAEITFDDVPVRIMTAPGEARKIDVDPLRVQVKLRGRRQQIEAARPSDIFAYVNAHDLTESTIYDLPIVIKLPADLQVVETKPAVASVSIGVNK